MIEEIAEEKPDDARESLVAEDLPEAENLHALVWGQWLWDIQEETQCSAEAFQS